ncbi:MATE family efflux transporter [Intestinimonas butyriciproducens]|uniref:MATE family efflux transporter n=1 Tax=Intestinimonas butyriciproducens TaxID=1297617 RepID=UPI00189EBB04|nr:MATE family efflux transporter [Intestinimonas butyriciproducens]
MGEQNDFSRGSVWKHIVNLAVPMTVAQIINVLYNIVDRIYIGHIPGAATDALTGVGLALPIITMISAFANLFGMGGAPLCSIARGAHAYKRAESIMGTSFFMLLGTGILLTLAFETFRTPVLQMFGASAQTMPYANTYIALYLLGTVFVMISLGMNSFINAQGFGKTGMLTVLIGAILNILLDPIFIFALDMGVKGAALATVISQGISALWVLRFLTGKKALLRLRLAAMRPALEHLKEILALGMSGFVMYISTSIVQIVCNVSLARYGGDLYIGVMTVLTSIREIVYTPLTGLTSGAQPVIGYNYGAKEYARVKQSIRMMTVACLAFTLAAWAAVLLFPHRFIQLFNSEDLMLEAGVPAMHIYFFGLFMAAFQFSGQFTFVALGRSKEAIFFSTLRKLLIVVPLTLILPMVGNLDANGVFLAEPISNFISGAACYATMYFVVWKRMLSKQEV